ncbi:MAG: N,N'-diacetylchitobiose phosphorylase [Eubacteriales bacterium]|nr:N,N'-diacetylchitobiose phosphorylase [Eubacteriales bacterium]
MRYGYFDGHAREYVITNPDTPAPWANYLGSPEYGAIITVNAGGYSFVKSGAAGRILRYTFNQFDEPGRYLYLRDDRTGDFWSASWKPVTKPLSSYHTLCRHGTAYTEFASEYAGIYTRALYYVPLGAQHEVWRLTVENMGDRPRAISVFGYCELTNENNYEQDLVNLQYTQFISRTEFRDDHILQHINEYCERDEDGANGRERFFGLAGAEVASCTGRREAFLGRRRFDAPQVLIDGQCDGSHCYNGNPCGALHAALILAPGEKRTLVFLLGQKTEQQARTLIDRYAENPADTAEAELNALKTYWHGKLASLTVTTPDERFNEMVNTWNAFQCFTTVVWSRAASLMYCGQRNGYGYRDTVQDIQGIIHLDPALARKRLTFMLSAQVHHGGGLPLVKFTHNPGHEDTPEQDSYVKATGHPHYRADDALWLFPTVYKYIAETGDAGYLHETVPYADRDEGTVLDHLKRAIDFSMTHLGPHGMPAGLHADWNDCLRLGAQGESTFVAFQLYDAMRIMLELAKDDETYTGYLKRESGKLLATLNELCFQGDRFIRGFTEAGAVIGGKDDAEAAMWLNPQSWAVISGAATSAQADDVMQTVFEKLNTPYGLEVMSPAYRYQAFDGARMLLFNPGAKENGGVFCQPQGWAILAEALLGHGERAFQYFAESSPASFNDNADLRVLEPYVHGQFIEGSESPYAGRAHVHWLTGTATTVMVGCVEGILGLRPTPEGLVVSPAIPAEWDGFTLRKVFRGKALNVTVQNPDHRESGVRQMTLNGRLHPEPLIREEELLAENELTVTL